MSKQTVQAGLHIWKRTWEHIFIYRDHKCLIICINMIHVSVNTKNLGKPRALVKIHTAALTSPQNIMQSVHKLKKLSLWRMSSQFQTCQMTRITTFYISNVDQNSGKEMCYVITLLTSCTWFKLHVHNLTIYFTKIHYLPSPFWFSKWLFVYRLPIKFCIYVPPIWGTCLAYPFLLSLP
jgi:hypothetical protein